MDFEEMRGAYQRATQDEIITRLRLDRNAWQNAANHLKLVVKTLIPQHKNCDCQACNIVKPALEEYSKAQQGVQNDLSA
jgi:hypothetical protein